MLVQSHRRFFSALASSITAITGQELWRYQLGAAIYAPPTTFMVDGRQYVVMPSGSTLTAFALPR